ncbi:efflux RND transporter periplasmic adaptor subunit [Phaeovulum sp. W22_SRMD_FR3]|uniref:efflux RND transporter periplasmic adaptor subunit n=1 Tax=Phaeovulum sp. W22_SRMD_FR3 TaxID=3240274 RepID=UPI003F9939CF
MRFWIRSLMGLFLVAMTVALLGAGGWMLKTTLDARAAEKAFPRQARERVFSANVAPVTVGELTPVLTSYGQVQSLRQLEIRAATAGRILHLSPNFLEGGSVQAGELLVQLDPAEAQAARDTLVASVSEAEAALAEAERAVTITGDDLAAAEEQARLREQALTRQRSLRAGGIGTVADQETAELAASTAKQAVLTRRSAQSTAQSKLDQARTTLERQRIALREAERKLADTEIRADFAGNLSGVMVVQGGLVSTNEQLASLIDPAALEVSFRVSTAQYARLLNAEGQLTPTQAEVALEVAGDELTATAHLSRVGAEVGEGLTGRLLYAQIDQGGAGFRPGDFVTLRLAEPALQDVAEVPASAVGSDGMVLALTDDERLEALPAKILRRQGDAVIVAAAALRGREIVTERSPLLGAGLRVRPIRSESAATGPATPPTAAAAPVTAQSVVLSPERRAKLIAYVEGNARMPAEAKARILAQLQQDEVPAQVIERLETRMGG